MDTYNLNPAVEPTRDTVDHYWWLVGGDAWQQWCQHRATLQVSS